MKIFKKPTENFKTEIPKMEDIAEKYDKQFLTKVGELYNNLTGKSLDKTKIYDSIEMLNKIRQNQEKTYLKALLFPEKVRGARIPTKFPTPSIAFTSTDTLLITTNSSGNFQLQWSPSMLLSSMPDATSLTNFGGEIWLNTVAGLDGFNVTSTRADYVAQNSLTNSFFTCLQAFRIVSACCIVQYVGSFQDTKGILGGAMDVQPGIAEANLNYSSFTNIDDKLYSQKTSPENGLKVNYFPVDTTDSLFLQVNSRPTQNYLATHTRILVYGQGLPISQQCIRIDFVKNCEGIPGPTGQDLLSTGYDLDYSESGDAFLRASKTLSNNFLATTTLEENKTLEQIFQKPNNTYKKILKDAKLEPNDANRLQKLQIAMKEDSTPNVVPTSAVFLNPRDINLQYTGN